MTEIEAMERLKQRRRVMEDMDKAYTIKCDPEDYESIDIAIEALQVIHKLRHHPPDDGAVLFWEVKDDRD